MDVWEHRALLCVLVVLGCLCVGVPSVAVADTGVVDAETGAQLGLDESTETAMERGLESGVDRTSPLAATELSPTVAESLTVQESDDDADNETDTDDGTDTDEENGADDDGTDGDDETGVDEDDATDADADTDADNESTTLGPTPPGYDELVIDIEIQENGTATWTLEYRYRLDGDDNATERWADVRSEIDDDPDGYLEQFEANWSTRVDDVAAETGREMDTSGYQLSIDETTTPHETGYVRFQFHWEEFARVELNRIEASDSFGQIELDERTQLIVRWPDGYDATSLEPLPDDLRESAAIWDGDESDFLEDEPVVELMAHASGDTESGDDDGTAVPLTWLAFAVLFTLLGAVIAGLLLDRAGWLERGRTDVGDGPTEPRTAEAADLDRSSPPGSEPVQGPVQAPPAELLSNEERVLKLLDERGGRMKQQEVVAELDWTEAKTSQVVSGLREEGSIDAFRIGRENVLTLTGDEAAQADGEAGDRDAGAQDDDGERR